MELLSVQIPEKHRQHHRLYILLCTTSWCTKKPLQNPVSFKSAHFAGPELDQKCPRFCFDVQSESLQSDAVINPKGTAGGRRVPLICTRTADEVYCIRKDCGSFLPPNVTVTLELQSGARLARELRARATVTQTAFWKRQRRCGSVNEPNLTGLLEACLWDWLPTPTL